MVPAGNKGKRLSSVNHTTTTIYQGVLEDEKLLRWRRLEDMSWRYPQDMSWRHLEDVSETNKMFLGISVSSKSKCVSNKSIFHKSISDKSKANLKCIN